MAETKVTPAEINGSDWQKTIMTTAYVSVTGTPTLRAGDSIGSGNPIEPRVDTGVQNDELFYKTVLEAGTYSFFLVHDKDTNRGQAQLRIDSTNVGSVVECYAASRVNQSYTTMTTGVVVTRSGLKDISIKAPSKNASSSGYILGLHRIDIVRTV